MMNTNNSNNRTFEDQLDYFDQVADLVRCIGSMDDDPMMIAAASGNPIALRMIGDRHFDDQNFIEAEKYYRLAAKGGDDDAQTRLGITLAQLERYREAAEYLRPAADAGDSNAQFTLGFAYANLGNISLEEKYLKMAAEQGDERAKMLLDSLNSFLRNRNRRRRK